MTTLVKLINLRLNGHLSAEIGSNLVEMFILELYISLVRFI